MVETRQFKVRVSHGHRVTTEDGLGTRWVDDPDTIETVKVSVNWDVIAEVMGPRAVKAKGRKAVEIGGLVMVTYPR